MNHFTFNVWSNIFIFKRAHPYYNREQKECYHEIDRENTDIPWKLDKKTCPHKKRLVLWWERLQEDRQNRKPSIYNPIKDYEKLVLTAINIGTAAMNKTSESELKEVIMAFVYEYGMLGLMTALPTTPDFITYEAVYLPKNHFIREENISTERYLSCFFPFDKYVNTAARHLSPQDQTWNSAPHNVRTSTMYIRAGRKKIIYQHRRSNCMGNSSIIMYTTEDGLTKIETTFDEDPVWLSLEQMTELFQRDKSTISRHIKNIFEEGELQRNSVVANFATTASDGKTYQVDYTQSFCPEAVFTLYLPALAYLDIF